MTVDKIPLEVRSFLEALQTITKSKFPDSVLTVLANFMFLRFFCPAILAPEGFKLIPSPPGPNHRRVFILIVKCIQSIVNGQPHLEKEPYMKPLRPFLENQTKRTNEYLLELSTIPKPSSVQLPKPSEKEGTLFLASFVNYLENNLKAVKAELNSAEFHPELRLNNEPSSEIEELSKLLSSER